MSDRQPCFLDAAAARDQIAGGQLSAAELLESCIRQTERIDPVVNAMITRAFDSARVRAQQADDAVSKGDELGPLHGLPVAIKDIQATRREFEQPMADRIRPTTFPEPTPESWPGFAPPAVSSSERPTFRNPVSVPTRSIDYSVPRVIHLTRT